MGSELSHQEQEQIFKLAEQLTGTCQSGRFRHQVLITNIARRIHQTGATNLLEYLAYAANDSTEYEQLVSALTIHTTSWFRENPHFDRLERQLSSQPEKFEGKKLRVFSAACSTGEEVYSTALVLEGFRSKIDGFDYEVVGIDIDRVSVNKAKKGIYGVSALPQIPERFRNQILKGRGCYEGLFTFREEVKARCKFATGNLQELKNSGESGYDVVVCRNVLIYFSPEDVSKIVSVLLTMLVEDGVLCLGHSEALEPNKFGVRALGNSCYVRSNTNSLSKSQDLSVAPQPRLLVVDDSATVRGSLSKLFGGAAFEVTAVASAAEATRSLERGSFDIITLDLHMPEEDGKTWLERQRRSGLRVPVVILSGASASEAVEVLGALEHGAQDYVEKGMLQKSADEVVDRVRQLATQYRNVTRGGLSKKTKQSTNLKHDRPDLILIGASTGGTEVLTRLLSHLPMSTPPVLVAQHITPNFAAAFAKRLAEVSGLKLGVMKTGTPLEHGHLYIALDDYHIAAEQRGGNLRLLLSNDGPVNRHRPSVDFLFNSGAKLKDYSMLAMILTGMGADGAKGLAALKAVGAMTMAQDEESCVVFGMPKEAIKLGAAIHIADPASLKNQLLTAISARPKSKSVSASTGRS